MYIYIYVTHKHTHTHTHIYIYIYTQGLHWDLLCGVGSMVSSLYIYIYIYIHFYPKRLTNEDNGNIYVCVCVCVCFVANMIYSNAIFSSVFINICAILYTHKCAINLHVFIFYPRAFFFTFYRGHCPTNLINFHFKFLHLIYKFNYNNVIVIIYMLSN